MCSFRHRHRTRVIRLHRIRRRQVMETRRLHRRRRHPMMTMTIRPHRHRQVIATRRRHLVRVKQIKS